MALATCLCMLSCSKDPDVTIYETMDFPKCLTPVNFKCTVEYVKISVNFNTFPDAEAYELELYTTNILTLGEDEELPEPELSMTFAPDELPYTFTGPEDKTCYIRLRAINNSANKEPSSWVTGNVKTTPDPATTCAAPNDAIVKVNFKKLTFTWTPADNVKQYQVEIYSETAPASGDKNPDTFLGEFTIMPSDLPFKVEVPVEVEDKTYYYRVRGINEEAGLNPSKWVRGNFKIVTYWWNDWDNTFDYGKEIGATRETKFTEADIKSMGLDKGKAVPAGETITWDGITYGPLTGFYGDKFSINRCKNWNKTDYSKDFPLESYESLTVSQPGILSFIPRITVGKVPELVIGLLTKRDGEAPSFEYIYQQNIVETSTIGTKNEENRLNIEITRDHLYGIIEPATIYVFCNLQSLTIYPIRWTRTDKDKMD